MNIQQKQPTKFQIREWLYRRQIEHKPLPDMMQIRRELGWNLIMPMRDAA